MINSILLVGLGGAAGSILRYLCQKSFNLSFPFGTLSVNVLGCLLIGILWGVLSKNKNDSMQLLLVTGFCGGFTTFSSFTFEGIQMLIDHRWVTFIGYTGISVTMGLLATFIGFKFSS